MWCVWATWTLSPVETGCHAMGFGGTQRRLRPRNVSRSAQEGIHMTASPAQSSFLDPKTLPGQTVFVISSFKRLPFPTVVTCKSSPSLGGRIF
jgi:hypothetical protein